MSVATAVRTCEICGAVLIHPRVKQFTCGGDCTVKRERLLRRAPSEERSCVICGARFESSHPLAVTCGKSCSAQRKKEVRAEQKRRWREKHQPSRVRECIDCGATFERAKGSSARRCLPCQDKNRRRQGYELVAAAPANAERRIQPEQPRMPKYFGDGEGGIYDLDTWLQREIDALKRAGKPRFISAEDRAALYPMRESGTGGHDL